MERRSLLGGGLALGATGAVARPRRHGVVAPGVETWSESLMLLHFDPEVRNGISVRLSRYPDRNATWAWCHVLIDGQLYAFTERRLPCSAARNTGESLEGVYDCPEAGVHFRRLGPASGLERIELSVRTRARRNDSGRDGPGDTPLSIRATFRSGVLKANTPPGRSEWTGDADIALGVHGRVVRLSGVAKAHEQTQIAPRFDAPFTYAMMWSPTASFISTASPARRYGDYEAEGRSRAVTEFRPTPPSAIRPFSATLSDGAMIRGVATRVAAYDVPVFDRLWNGNIVRVELDGTSLVGMMNDWRPDAQVFAAT